MFKKKSIVIFTILLTFVFCNIIQAFEFQGYDAQVPEGRQYDLGGLVIKIDPARLVTDSGAAREPQEYYADPRNAPYYEWVQETFNCTFEWLPRQSAGSNGQGELSRLAAPILAGDIPSYVLTMQAGALTNAVGEGFFHDLAPYLDEPDYYNGKTYFESYPVMFKAHRLDLFGKTFMFWGGVGNLENCDPMVMAVNLDLLESVGVDPDAFLQMVEDKKWDWDAYAEIMRKTTLDIDGDGNLDLSTFNEYAPFVHHKNMKFMMASTGTDWIVEKDGRLVSNLTDNRIIQMLQFIKDVNKELLAKMGQPPVEYTHKGVWDAGTAAFSGMKYGPLGWVLGQSNPEQAASFKWAIIPTPMGPDMDDYTVGTSREPLMSYIPISVPNPRAIMEVMAALNRTTAPYRDIEAYEKEYIEKYTNNSPDENSAKWIEWAFEQEAGTCGWWDRILWAIRTKDENGNDISVAALLQAVMSSHFKLPLDEPVSSLEKVNTLFQARLDELYNEGILGKL